MPRLRFACFLSALLAIAPTAGAQGVDPEVQKHFEVANALYAEQRYADALVEYDKAYALSKNWKILYNRGQCLVMLRREPEAIESFERYLKDGGAEVPEERRTAVEHDIVNLKKRLGHLALAGAPDGAEIAIDGNAVATAPLKEPVPVGAGAHELSVRAKSGAPFVKKIVVVAGETLDVKVEMPVEKPAPLPPPAPAPKTNETSVPSPAFTVAAILGLAAPTGDFVRGRLLPLGQAEISAGWRFHPLWSVGAFLGAASGRLELAGDAATAARVQTDAQYSYALGGVRARLHLLRDKYFDGWIGADFGVWRETWRFSGQPESVGGFDFLATSPVFGVGAGLDFPLAREWALGASFRVIGTSAEKGSRTACSGARCEGALPGGREDPARGFFEFGARLTWSIPYGDAR